MALKKFVFLSSFPLIPGGKKVPGKNLKQSTLVLKSLIHLVFVLSVTEGQAKPPSPSSLGKEQRVVVALGSAPRSLDPRRATDAGSQRLTDLLFQPLVRLGPDLEAKPALAQSWSYKNKVYTFVIPSDVSFSHGRKISREDLLFSFEEYKKGPFASSFEVVESVKVQKKGDNFVLKIKLKKPSAKFLRADLPILKILPRDRASKKDFHRHPVGTGPFQLKKFSSSQLVFRAWRKKDSFSIKEVVFKIIRDDGTRFQKMLNEELDIVQSDMPFLKMAYFENKKDRFQVFRGPGLSTTYMLINLKDPCLKNKDLRQLLSYALDRRKIIQYKLKGLARPARTVLSPADPFFNPHLPPPVHNLKKAKDLWKTLPEKCQKKVFSFKSSHARSAVDHGKVLALQLKRAGLRIKRESYEWGRFYSDLNEGHFQLALLKWVGIMDPDIYRVAFHSREFAPRGRNRGFYQNSQLDQLLEEGAGTMDPDRRKAVYHRVQEIVQKDLAFVPLWHEEQTAVLRKNIVNYRLSRAGDFRYLLHISKTGR